MSLPRGGCSSDSVWGPEPGGRHRRKSCHQRALLPRVCPRPGFPPRVRQEMQGNRSDPEWRRGGAIRLSGWRVGLLPLHPVRSTAGLALASALVSVSCLGRGGCQSSTRGQGGSLGAGGHRRAWGRAEGGSWGRCRGQGASLAQCPKGACTHVHTSAHIHVRMHAGIGSGLQPLALYSVDHLGACHPAVWTVPALVPLQCGPSRPLALFRVDRPRLWCSMVWTVPHGTARQRGRVGDSPSLGSALGA